MTTADELGIMAGSGDAAAAAEMDTTSTRAALAVYQQYQALSGDVNRLQKERLAVEDATAQLRAQIEKLTEERRLLEARTVAAQEEGHAWRQRLRAAHDKASSSSSSSSSAAPLEASDEWVRKQAADLRLRVQERQMILRERRDQYHRESRAFRHRACREASVRATAVGLPRTVATHAYLALHGRFDFEAQYMPDDGIAAAASKSQPPADATEALEANSHPDSALPEGDDPTLWTDLFTGDEAKDREVRELLQSYKATKRQNEQAQLDRDAASERVRAAREKLERRHERRDAVRTQLERVNQEVVDLEAQVRALRCRTDEAAAGIGISTANDAGGAPPAAKRARVATAFVSPSPPVQRSTALVNPYARGAMASVPSRATATTTTAGDSSPAVHALPLGASEARRRPDVQTAVLGVRRGGDDLGGNRRPSSRHPYSRRHGRNREFGCALVVEDGTNLDASWGAARPPSPQPDDTDDDDPADKPVSAPAQSSLAQTLRLLEEDDDEDDSWLYADPWANKA